MSQFARGQSRALGQHRPSGVGGMSPPGQSSVRHPMAEQSLVTMDPFIIRAVSTCIVMLIMIDIYTGSLTQKSFGNTSIAKN